MDASPFLALCRLLGKQAHTKPSSWMENRAEEGIEMDMERTAGMSKGF